MSNDESTAAETTKSKKAKKKLTGRSESDALAAAKQWARDDSGGHATSPVRNGQPGWHYVYFTGGSADDPILRERRETLVSAGYEPVNGPLYDGDAERLEYVAAQPLAEIWRCTARVAALHFERRMKRAHSKPNWVLLQSNRMSTAPSFLSKLPTGPVDGDN